MNYPRPQILTFKHQSGPGYFSIPEYKVFIRNGLPQTNSDFKEIQGNLNFIRKLLTTPYFGTVIMVAFVCLFGIFIYYFLMKLRKK